MKLYRIYTENKNEERVKQLLSLNFDGFTVIRATGAWQGKYEDSLLIEIYTNNALLIKSIANIIKYENKQEAILLTETECKLELV